MSNGRVFLLSPAWMGGVRGGMLLADAGGGAVAAGLRAGGVPLGEAFAFVSGLYFRGKLAYAAAFGRGAGGVPGALVITPTRGLVPPDAPVTVDVLREFAAGDVDAANAAYRGPLVAHLHALDEATARCCEVVLLGSVATGKYVDVLLDVLGPRLLFPAEFVGRGDMSRGGLLLRKVEEGMELEYVPVRGAVRRGPRPPKLAPR
jgi:hypothetical protein